MSRSKAQAPFDRPKQSKANRPKRKLGTGHLAAFLYKDQGPPDDLLSQPHPKTSPQTRNRLSSLLFSPHRSFSSSPSLSLLFLIFALYSAFDSHPSLIPTLTSLLIHSSLPFPFRFTKNIPKKSTPPFFVYPFLLALRFLFYIFVCSTPHTSTKKNSLLLLFSQCKSNPLSLSPFSHGGGFYCFCFNCWLRNSQRDRIRVRERSRSATRVFVLDHGQS